MAVTVMEVKRGDTFSYAAAVTNGKKGPPINISGWTIRSQIRTTTDQLLVELSVEMTDSVNGAYRLYYDGSTTAWPIGNANMDIEYTENGKVKSTDTVVIKIVKDITLPASP
jgi:hypothetical protein